MAMYSLQSLVDQARERLGAKRFIHVLGVTHTVVGLAHHHGIDPEAAGAAGLLHDISKPLSPERIEAELAEWGEPIEQEDRPFPAIWHGVHAAALGRQTGFRLGGERADDGVAQAICEAVRVHSTAEADLSPLAMALFIADYTEPTRGFEAAAGLLGRARANLDDGFAAVLEHKMAYMRERGMPISPRAERALEAAPTH